MAEQMTTTVEQMGLNIPTMELKTTTAEQIEFKSTKVEHAELETNRVAQAEQVTIKAEGNHSR